jgi:hypothetical protein
MSGQAVQNTKRDAAFWQDQAIRCVLALHSVLCQKNQIYRIWPDKGRQAVRTAAEMIMPDKTEVVDEALSGLGTNLI